MLDHFGFWMKDVFLVSLEIDVKTIEKGDKEISYSNASAGSEHRGLVLAMLILR